MGDIGQKDDVLPPRCLQLGQYPIMPLLFRLSPVDPVPGDLGCSYHHHRTKEEAHPVLGLCIIRNGTQKEKVVQKSQDI